MDWFEIRCPNCNSRLKCEDGFESYTCPYCESEFILEDQDPDVEKARIEYKKESNRLDAERHKADLKYDIRKKQIELEEKKEDHQHKSSIIETNYKVFLYLFLAGIIIILWIALSIGESKANKERGFDPTNLNSMAKRVHQLIDLHEFDEAEVIIDQIHYDGSFLEFAEHKKWNDTRKTLEKQLETAKKSYEKELKDAEKQAEKEAKQAEKEAKQAEKEAQKGADSSFWSFLPWVA